MLYPNRGPAPRAVQGHRHIREYLLLVMMLAALLVLLAVLVLLGRPGAPLRPIEEPPFHLVTAGVATTAGLIGGAP